MTRAELEWRASWLHRNWRIVMEGLGYHYPGLCARSGKGKCSQCHPAMESYGRLSQAGREIFRGVAQKAVSSDLESAWAIKKQKLAEAARKRQEDNKSPWKAAGDHPTKGQRGPRRRISA